MRIGTSGRLLQQSERVGFAILELMAEQDELDRLNLLNGTTFTGWVQTNDIFHAKVIGLNRSWILAALGA